MFRAPLSQRASLWPSFPSYPVSWDKASHCEKKKKGGKKREKTRERHNLWHPLNLICNVCETSWKCLSCERRGGGVRLWAASKGTCSSDRRESWTAASQMRIPHTHFPLLWAVCVDVCSQAEVIKDSERLRSAMFTLSFCYPYKSQSHNISFSSRLLCCAKAQTVRRCCYLAP